MVGPRRTITLSVYHFIYKVLKESPLIKSLMAGNVWTYSLAESAEMPVRLYLWANAIPPEGGVDVPRHGDTSHYRRWTVKVVLRKLPGHPLLTANTFVKEKTDSIEIVDDRTITFHFNEPFLDFIDLYAVVGGANWVLPSKYYEELGAEAFKQLTQWEPVPLSSSEHERW